MGNERDRNATRALTAPQVVLASHNAGKLAELRSLFAALGRELIALPERTALVADETAQTFIENALIKARHAAQITGLPALADDSGLCVQALAGEPGVHSARYAGESSANGGASDAANNASLLRAMEGMLDRRAYFICVLVYLQSPQDPEPSIAIGRWPGLVLQAPRGDSGFGYDPLFFDPELQRSSAELDRATKNSRSHRARAAAELQPLLMQRFASASASAFPSESGSGSSTQPLA